MRNKIKNLCLCASVVSLSAFCNLQLHAAHGYSPLQGATYRANLMRDGNYHIKDAPTLSAEKWKFKTGGAVKATPVVVNGVVYVGSEDKTFYALDAETGKEKWTFKAGGGIATTATVYKDSVFFLAMDGKVYCLDAKDGKKKWDKGFPVEKKTSNFLVSVGVAYGVVFTSTGAAGLEAHGWGGGRLIGLDVDTGEKVWEQQDSTGPDCASSMVIVAGKIYMDAKWDFNTCIDLATGNLEWMQRNTTKITAGHYYSTHAYYDGMIYAVTSVGGDSSGGSQMAEVIAVDTKNSTGRSAWKKYPYDQFGEGALRQKPLDGKDHKCYAAPAVADGTVFVGNNDGHLYTFDAKSGKEKWKFNAHGAIKSAPSYGAGTIFFGCDNGHVYAVDAGSGKEKGKFPISGKTYSSPSLTDGTLYIGNEDGFIYAIK